eukprot:1181024-Prorocentrum_minimum.AAC.6
MSFESDKNEPGGGVGFYPKDELYFQHYAYLTHRFVKCKDPWRYFTPVPGGKKIHLYPLGVHVGQKVKKGPRRIGQNRRISKRANESE